MACGNSQKDLRKHVFEPLFYTKKEGKEPVIGLTVVKTYGRRTRRLDTGAE